MNKYIDENLDELPPENRKRVEETILKYPNNKWWRSSDPVEIAKYQIFEEILMVKFDIFHEGIEKLLGRPVFTYEFGMNYEGLKKEATKAISLLESGESLETSSNYKAEKVQESVNLLSDYCDKKGKKLRVIEV